MQGGAAMKRHTFRPRLEELEKRDTPSIVPAIVAYPIPPGKTISAAIQAAVGGSDRPTESIGLNIVARILVDYGVRPPPDGGGAGMGATVGEGRSEYGPPDFSRLPPVGINVALNHVPGDSVTPGFVSTPDHDHG
jgi:hypothetical protein